MSIAIVLPLLGAAALGDLGEHFPDTDPVFEGIGGLDLLGRAREMIRVAGCHPVSADLTVIAERPSIAPVRDAMRRALCDALGIPLQHQAIVTWPDASGEDLGRLIAAGVRASGRAGRLRASFHLWNDESDVEQVIRALRA